MGDTSKTDIISMYKLINKYNLRDKTTVDKVCALAEQKGMFTSARGKLFLQRIRNLSSGKESDISCIFCKKETINGVICTVCEEKIKNSLDNKVTAETTQAAKRVDTNQVSTRVETNQVPIIVETTQNELKREKENSEKITVEKSKKIKKPFNLKSFFIGVLVGMIVFAAIEAFLADDSDNRDKAEASTEYKENTSPNNSYTYNDIEETGSNEAQPSREASASSIDFANTRVKPAEFIKQLTITMPQLAKKISSSGDDFTVDLPEKNISDYGDAIKNVFVQYVGTSSKFYEIDIYGNGYGILRLSLDKDGYVVGYDAAIFENSQIGAIILMMTVNTLNPNLEMSDAETIISNAKAEGDIYVYGDYGYGCMVENDRMLLNVVARNMITK